MKNLITEINRNRVLMGLEVINEGTGLAGIIDAIANGLASNMVKKVTTEIVDSFPAIFKYDLNTAAGKAARTKFINGGLASLKSALAKISRKEALEIIVKVDTAQIAKLASLIEKEETELMAQIGSLVEKGVDDDMIKKSLGELTDIPDSVVSVLLSKVSIEKLFTEERIKATAKTMIAAAGKNLNKISQTAIDTYRTSNPGATEQQIAEYLIETLPYSLFSVKKLEQILGKGTAGAGKLARMLLFDKKTGKLSWSKFALYVGTATVIKLASWIHSWSGELPQPTSLIEKFKADPRYSCYAKYITPSQKGDEYFIIEEVDGSRAVIKHIKGNFYYVDNKDTPLKEVSCK